MKSFVVVKLMGRCGNQFYQIATAMAYAWKSNMGFFTTSNAEPVNRLYFPQFPQRDIGGTVYEERRNEQGNPYYAVLPHGMSNPYLIGYWQSFKYFEEFKERIWQEFNLPYQPNDYVSIHVRRGDYLEHSDVFPPLPLEYYQKAVELMNKKGYFKFLIFSDDIDYCKSVFVDENFDERNQFHYSENKSELEDISLMSSCKHNILANSSFGFAASFFNRNENKIVVCPTMKNMFAGCNIDMIPESYTQIEF